MELIPDRIDSTFRYILIAAKRAEQLVRGAKPRVEMPNRKPSRVAIRPSFTPLRIIQPSGRGMEMRGPNQLPES